MSVSKGPNENDLYRLKLSALSSNELTKSVRSDAIATLDVTLEIETPYGACEFESFSTEPFCLISHNRYAPQALFRMACQHFGHATDETILNFVFGTLLQSKLTEGKILKRKLKSADVDYFTTILKATQTTGGNLIKNMVLRDFGKLNTFNGFWNEITNLVAGDEVFKLWNEERIDGFMTKEAAEKKLREHRGGISVRFSQEHTQMDSIIVSTNHETSVRHTTIKVCMNSESATGGEGCTPRFEVYLQHGMVTKTTLEEAIEAAKYEYD